MNKNSKLAIAAVILVSCVCLCTCVVLTIILLTTPTSTARTTASTTSRGTEPEEVIPSSSIIFLNETNSLIVDDHTIYTNLGNDYEARITHIVQDLTSKHACVLINIQDSVVDKMYCVDLQTYQLMWQESVDAEFSGVTQFKMQNHNLVLVEREDLNGEKSTDYYVVRMSLLATTSGIDDSLKSLLAGFIKEQDTTKLNKFYKLRISENSARLIIESRCEIDCDDSHTGTATFQSFELKNGNWIVGSKEVRTICRGSYYSDLVCV